MNTHPTDLHASEQPAESTRAILEETMANKPDPLACAYARITLLEGLLREAEPYTQYSFSDQDKLGNRIAAALRKPQEVAS